MPVVIDMNLRRYFLPIIVAGAPHRRWNVNKEWRIRFVISTTTMTSKSATRGFFCALDWGRKSILAKLFARFEHHRNCQHWSWSVKNGILTMTGFMDPIRFASCYPEISRLQVASSLSLCTYIHDMDFAFYVVFRSSRVQFAILYVCSAMPRFEQQLMQMMGEKGDFLKTFD